jgi:hypothetical protein
MVAIGDRLYGKGQSFYHHRVLTSRQVSKGRLAMDLSDVGLAQTFIGQYNKYGCTAKQAVGPQTTHPEVRHETRLWQFKGILLDGKDKGSLSSFVADTMQYMTLP